MRKRFLLSGLVLILIAIPAIASALIINFDDLATSSGYGLIPSDYLGFTWTGGTGWEISTNSFFKSTYGNSGDFPSLSNAAYNDTGAATMSISFGGLYNVDSAYFRSWSQNNTFQSYSAQNLTVSGYNGATSVGSVVIPLSATGMVQTQLNFASIDRLEFTSTQDRWWLVDDIEANAVPLPGAVLLLGAGLARLTAYARRRQD